MKCILVVNMTMILIVRFLLFSVVIFLLLYFAKKDIDETKKDETQFEKFLLDYDKDINKFLLDCDKDINKKMKDKLDKQMQIFKIFNNIKIDETPIEYFTHVDDTIDGKLMESLELHLEYAISVEDYESAAKFRDLINKKNKHV